MKDFNDLLIEIEKADAVLIGIGEEFAGSEDNEELVCEAYNKLGDILHKKNYFVLSQCKDAFIYKSNILRPNIATPICEVDVDSIDYDAGWDLYLKWLSFTLNRELLVIELGVLMSMPQIIRWPFEKAVMINNKAKLYRINNSLPNIPAEIADKAEGIKKNAIDFVLAK